MPVLTASVFSRVLLRSSRDPGWEHSPRGGAIHSSARQMRSVAPCLNSFWILGYVGRSKLGPNEFMSEDIVTISLDHSKITQRSWEMLRFKLWEMLRVRTPRNAARIRCGLHGLSNQFSIRRPDAWPRFVKTVLTCHVSYISIKT